MQPVAFWKSKQIFLPLGSTMKPWALREDLALVPFQSVAAEHLDKLCCSLLRQTAQTKGACSLLGGERNPEFGFLLASYALKIYVEPSLTPFINHEDPRWIGAWWLGK